MFPAPSFAQNSQDLASSDCAGLVKPCAAAARELKAARALIEGYENQIIAHDARLEVARKEIETLKSIGALEAERAAKLEAVIAAEREAKAALLDKIMLQEKRIGSLEKKLSRSRKFTFIAVGVTAVGVLVLSRK